jgi:hypothetical protein
MPSTRALFFRSTWNQGGNCDEGVLNSSLYLPLIRLLIIKPASSSKVPT